jgi:hypothetical protein
VKFTRKPVAAGVLVATLLGLLFAFLAGATGASADPGNTPGKTPDIGAVFTTVNENKDGPDHCKNGQPDINCNIYDGKQFVWMSGGPATAGLADGSYFFAVLDPGGQQDPNDGSAKNLSSPHDTYLDRSFSISNGVVTNLGTHDFDNNKIRLMDYNDTSNPGGEYVMAVCALPPVGSQADPSACKYDAFKVQAPDVVHGKPLVVTKDAAGSYTDTFKWDIAKDVDKTKVEQSGSDATFHYTVSATHDAGTISDVQVKGTIEVSNPNVDASNNIVPVSNVDVTDTLSDGTVCSVVGGSNVTLTEAKTAFAYTCDLTGKPQGQLDNTVTAVWGDQNLSSGAVLDGSSANFTFSSISFQANNVDESVNVTDSVEGVLGTVSVGDPNPKLFTYDHIYTGNPAGTCTSHDNTATFIANDSGATGSASKTVTVCVGADLTVQKTAVPSYTRTYQWSIGKDVDKTTVKQVGGSAVFNYTVNANETQFADSEWAVNGQITVTNPNDWEPITVDVTDAIDNGGVCTVVGGNSVVVPKSDSVTLNYSCTYASAPVPAAGTNTATAKWDASAANTPDGSADGTAAAAFTDPTKLVNKTVTVSDSYKGVLGTLTATDVAPYAGQPYTYARTIPVPAYDCQSYDNTAKIVETDQSASKRVKVCGPVKTGALTMGYWQNKNGQAIITSGQSTAGVANSATWLQNYAPFKDLGPATPAQTAAYVTKVINAANASGASLNAMLKAQMLSTALDVYFSDPALGGNKIGAPAPIGAVAIDLTKVCSNPLSCTSYVNASSAFGGASSLPVSQILAYEASQSNVGGSAWYGQVKSVQVLAKDVNDAINNMVAFGP